LAAEREELSWAGLRLPVLSDRRRTGEQLVGRLPGHGDSGQITLDVCRKDRNSGGRDLLGHQL
jgi:hypothetical protein